MISIDLLNGPEGPIDTPRFQSTLLYSTNRARHKMSKKTILNFLFLCHEFPRPDIAASNRRLVDMLQMISKRHRVDLLCPGWTRSFFELRYKELYRSMGVRVLFMNEGELERQLLRRAYDVCVFEWWVTVPTAIDSICRIQPWATLIVDAVDVCFRREEASLAMGHLDAAKVAENRIREIEAYRAADALIAVSSEDMATLRECGIASPIYFIPMIEPIRPRLKIPRDRELLFVGTFGINLANVDAVLWFVGEVWPSVREAVPDARLTLVGSNLIPEIERLAQIPGIEVVGFVPDLKPYLDRAAVSIAPLRFGGGMKGKVTEAMSRGIPLVTTHFGAQGLGVTSGEHLIIADDAQSFASGVITLLRDEEAADRMGLAGQQFIARLCSPEVVESQMQEALTWSLSRPKPRPSLGWFTKSATQRMIAPFRTILGKEMPATLKALGKRYLPSFLWKALRKTKKAIH